jgi:hypothetical protein
MNSFMVVAILCCEFSNLYFLSLVVVFCIVLYASFSFLVVVAIFYVSLDTIIALLALYVSFLSHNCC